MFLRKEGKRLDEIIRKIKSLTAKKFELDTVLRTKSFRISRLDYVNEQTFKDIILKGRAVGKLDKHIITSYDSFTELNKEFDGLHVFNGQLDILVNGVSSSIMACEVMVKPDIIIIHPMLLEFDLKDESILRSMDTLVFRMRRRSGLLFERLSRLRKEIII